MHRPGAEATPVDNAQRPNGRVQENGAIPEQDRILRDADSADPAVRITLNVRDSDATLIISHDRLSGGAELVSVGAAGGVSLMRTARLVAAAPGLPGTG